MDSKPDTSSGQVQPGYNWSMLDDIVNLTISRASVTASRPGFGIPLFMVNKVPAGWGPNRVREFTTLKEMTDAGFLVTDPAYLMASKLKAQNPSPRRWKIARRVLQTTSVVKLTVLPGVVQGDIYSVTFGNGTVTYTAAASPTPTTVATALAALIAAPTGWTAGTAAGVITLTAAAGALPAVQDWTSNLSFEDASTDPGIATDLVAAVSQDPDWYGLSLDSGSKAENLAAAAWTESNKKLFVAETSDTAVTDQAITNDVASAVKTGNYFRTAVLYSHKNPRLYAGVAWIGNRFPYDPSQAPDAGGTWAYKTLAGTNDSSMTGGQVSAVINKNANVYTRVAGIAVTQYGKTGGGEWIDVIRFLDWLESEIKTRVFELLASRGKIPYTDSGIDSIKNVISAVLRDGVTAGGLAADPAPVVTAPLASEVSPADKANRNLPNVLFSATLAGAIHTVSISGSVSV